MTNDHTGPQGQELLPCPFCGSTDIGFNVTEYVMSCMGCSTEGPFGKDRDAAIAAWNRRTPEPQRTEAPPGVSDGSPDASMPESRGEPMTADRIWDRLPWITGSILVPDPETLHALFREVVDALAEEPTPPSAEVEALARAVQIGVLDRSRKNQDVKDAVEDFTNSLIAALRSKGGAQ